MLGIYINEGHFFETHLDGMLLLWNSNLLKNLSLWCSNFSQGTTVAHFCQSFTLEDIKNELSFRVDTKSFVSLDDAASITG